LVHLLVLSQMHLSLVEYLLVLRTKEQLLLFVQFLLKQKLLLLVLELKKGVLVENWLSQGIWGQYELALLAKTYRNWFIFVLLKATSVDILFLELLENPSTIFQELIPFRHRVCWNDFSLNIQMPQKRDIVVLSA